MSDLPQRLYQTKLTLLAVIFAVVGIALMILAHNGPSGLFSNLPIGEIGSGLFTTGVIGVALQYLDERDAEERGSARLRRVLREEAPAIRDAVVDGFAFSPTALTQVTSPEVLSRVVENSLAVQLADAELARAAQAQLLQAAMTPAGRYQDSRLTVRLGLSPSARHLRAVIRREYHFIPSESALRFACVENRDEYSDLLRDPETAEVWRMRASEGLRASDEQAFRVTSVELEGDALPVRRTERKGAQVYTCRLPMAVQPAPVHLAYELEVLLPRDEHSLYFDFGRPTNGLAIEATVASRRVV